MSMPRAVRHINETRALEALFRSGPMSRADLARQLHVTRSTASSIVAALVKAGYAEVDGAEPADRGARTGRPGTNVRLRPQRAIFLGADVGVKRGTVAAIDLAAETVALEACTFDPDRPSPEAVADQLAALIRSVITRVQVPSAISGLNITVPGLVDHDGNVLRAPIRDWANVPILALMRERGCRRSTSSASRTTPTPSPWPISTVRAKRPSKRRLTSSSTPASAAPS